VDLLKEAGFDVEYPFAGIPTAFRGRKGKGGPKVALLVEYDALPGIGHACGHNLSGAMSTLAGMALASVSDELDGEIHVIGTPAEETNGAKVAMSEKGVFDDLDLALMLHCGGCLSFVRYESLAVDALEFIFNGKASHASASPWMGRNALNGVQLFFHAVDMLRQHLPPEVRMHGIITSGEKLRISFPKGPRQSSTSALRSGTWWMRSSKKRKIAPGVRLWPRKRMFGGRRRRSVLKK
jgi:amidohydrolase